jgi:lysozyme
MPNADPVNAATLALIIRNEGCVLHTYTDAVGVPTCCVGHTGPEAVPGRQFTQAEADALLASDLDTFEQGVDSAIGDVPTGENEYGAMVSLAFNIGGAHFAASSVCRLHKAGDKQGAADAFLLWNKAAGHVLAGLDRRRHEERTLYLKPDAEAPELPNNQPAAAAPPAAQRGDLIAWLRRELGV